MLFTFENHALGGVSGVASFITTDEQLQKNRACCFLVQAMLPGGFPFHQFNRTISLTLVLLEISDCQIHQSDSNS